MTEFKILILLRVPHQSLAVDGELATDLKTTAYPLLIQSQGPAHTLRKFVGICLNTNPCIQALITNTFPLDAYTGGTIHQQDTWGWGQQRFWSSFRVIWGGNSGTQSEIWEREFLWSSEFPSQGERPEQKLLKSGSQDTGSFASE